MEKLTTGQMIDRLGIDDTATNQDGYKVGYDHKGNLLMWGQHESKPDNREGNDFLVYLSWVKNDSWIINYNFVGFEEAQTAHANEKKTVIYWHDEETQYKFVYGEYGHFRQLANDGIGLEELTNGKWIIEN
ncbi:hypothetical protein AF332_11860 [Sporosarcina globispora]|uniref:Uncharacterized protein n=1 Tax=Sporosarcina globispora TaxID=1459 RepID=A0A0M0GCA1_SPOGL|nr:hypothetical protein [Sporosarcina globispora]KON87454.1 hypothetical protein AF332_11860 [Sporosarcina globispora]